MSKAIVVSILISGVMLVGCASNKVTEAPVSENKPGSIKREQTRTEQTGMITHVKDVTVLGKRSSIGGTMGRTAGSIAGGAVGSGYGSVAGSIIGSVIGGMAGANADKQLQRQPGYELTVRLDDGSHVTVTQLAKETFKPGDKVRLIMKEGQAQVVHRS